MMNPSNDYCISHILSHCDTVDGNAKSESPVENVGKHPMIYGVSTIRLVVQDFATTRHTAIPGKVTAGKQWGPEFFGKESFCLAALEVFCHGRKAHKNKI